MKLPKRTYNTMSDAIALSSPSGKMSKRARAEAEERLRRDLFGDEPVVRIVRQRTKAERIEQLRRVAVELRALAEHGMKTKAYRRKAEQLEAEATELETSN